MAGYSLHGDTESIRGLFDELQQEGIPLDRSLVSRLFDAYVTRSVALVTIWNKIFLIRSQIFGHYFAIQESEMITVVQIFSLSSGEI